MSEEMNNYIDMLSKEHSNFIQKWIDTLNTPKLDEYVSHLTEEESNALFLLLIIKCTNLFERDNAPTVNYPFYQEAYQTGYEEGKNERPRGEWIKVKEERMSIDMSGEIVTGYKCSKCGRLILTIPSNLADYPFCHCGAYMKGGAE